MQIIVLTLFPEMFDPIINTSILKRAVEKKLVKIDLVDIRDYTKDKHKKVDDTPFGGGAGMVMAVQPVSDALLSQQGENKRVIYLSPRGKILDQELLTELAKEEELILLCGHYEGMDQRVLDRFQIEEVSIGDYILTGGELPAMVLMDSLIRLLPGVLSGEESAEEESIYMGLLEYPHYTKPRSYEGMEVPEILFGGNHKVISLWKLEEALRLTKKRRPDLYEAFKNEREIGLTKEEKALLEKVDNED